MYSRDAERLTPDELQQAVAAADPAAFLVLPRIVRRVIKQDCQLGGFGFHTPHRKSYWIARQPLLEAVEPSELGLESEAELPETVILLARPSPKQYADAPAGELLIHGWRLLFHARIHLALAESLAAGRLDAAAIHERIHAIGSAEFDEIRIVLDQEALLLPPASDETAYVEFAATYLELRYFAPTFLAHFFPGLTDLAAIDALLRQDVDAEGLFQAARPTGASAPVDVSQLDEWGSPTTASESVRENVPASSDAISEAKYRYFMRKSRRPAEVGNVVRAAICHARAERCAPGHWADRVHVAIREDVQILTSRLQVALQLDDADLTSWREVLVALIGQTPRGIWTVEARLLYDLQKVCVDHERKVYTVDLTEWALSWGRRPIKRPLPNQHDVLLLKHLRSALARLPAVRIPDERRRLFANHIVKATGCVESRLRGQLRPLVADVLDEVDLKPQNPPERVARKKLIEELLDRVVDRGFLTIGDLRDAISRNELKLPDLAGPQDLVEGDPLLRADHKLASVLDGVYRRGEFYLRWMQRLSSVGFGTKTGRFLTRFAVVPFGGAYVVLAGLHELWHLVAGKPTFDSWGQGFLDSGIAACGALWTTVTSGAGGATAPLSACNAGWTMAKEGFRLASPSWVLALGVLFLCLINSAAFRRGFCRFMVVSGRMLRTLVVESIRWLIQWPILQLILRSRPFLLLLRFLVKPLFWTLAVWWLLPESEANWWTIVETGVPIFLTINLLLNSRVGRNVEEIVADEVRESWRRFGLRIIVGLFWLTVDMFRRLMETIERLMYTVDEWLRFRSGERQSTLAAKAVLGLMWFFVAYVVRFGVSVLLEPQINPIKHFPVVTVAHKLLLGLYQPFARLLETTLEPAMAWTVALGVIWCIPGVFGFLVWELKENWRLYAANRRRTLQPVMIGMHGETMARLLRPGFHSGTLPKRYAKLRRAERHARLDGIWRAVQKHVKALHSIERSVRRWVDREFVALLSESRAWQLPPPMLDAARLGANSIHLSFGCLAFDDHPLRMVVAARSGWLVANVTELGWAKRISPESRLALAAALTGLYKSAGVHLVGQQIESEFPPPAPWYDLSPEGLIVWPDRNCEVEVFYDLRETPWIAPQAVRGLSRRRLPTIERDRLVFSETTVSWQRWVEVWNLDIAGQGHPRDGVAGVCVLP